MTTQRILNYPGDVAHTFTTGEAKGPSYMGETWYVTEANYDPTLNRTVVGFSLVRPSADA
jgi:hypothetical protein